VSGFDRIQKGVQNLLKMNLQNFVIKEKVYRLFPSPLPWLLARWPNQPAILAHTTLSIPLCLLRLRGENPHLLLFRFEQTPRQTVAPRAFSIRADELPHRRRWRTAAPASSPAESAATPP
jgi:hypothetical protein